MKVNAISRIHGEQKVRVRLDDFQCDGTFQLDGSLLSGTYGSISQAELAFRIWAQNQHVKLTERELREAYSRRV